MMNAVDDVRLARTLISEGGFAGLGDYLHGIREEYRSRTGRFADLPTEQPEDVRRMIEAAETDSESPLIEEIRAVRKGLAGKG